MLILPYLQLVAIVKHNVVVKQSPHYGQPAPTRLTHLKTLLGKGPRSLPL